MPHIEEVDDDYDLDAVLDEPPVSNFLAKEQEAISPRELTFRKDELRGPDETSFSFVNVAAFIMACCIAHFFLVTGGYIGKGGMTKLDRTVKEAPMVDYILVILRMGADYTFKLYICLKEYTTFLIPGFVEHTPAFVPTHVLLYYAMHHWSKQSPLGILDLSLMADPPKSVQSFDTIYPADSLEFCPIIGYQDYFVCGTYYLQKDEPSQSDNGGNSGNNPEEDSSNDPSSSREKKRQTRLGKCWLFQSNTRGGFENVQEIDMPAILDLKWSYTSNDKPRLAIADSVGHLRFYDLQNSDEETPSVNLTEIQALACTAEQNICLSLDWSDRHYPTSSGSRVTSSISDGTIVIVDADKAGYKVTSQWHAHEFEPWIAAWDYWNTSIVYTGGDDLSWKAWDSRTDLTSPVFSNKRSFEGGVTTIQSHPYRENCVAVGSYDERVRIFDTRKPMTPVHTVHVGGGAWRVKWHPSVQRQNDLLVACMHDGFKIVQVGPKDGGSLLNSSTSIEPTIVRFDEHGSLAYGVDWCHRSHQDRGSEHEEGSALVGSCSFYDHSLKTWFA